MRLFWLAWFGVLVSACNTRPLFDETLAGKAQAVLRVDCRQEAEVCEKYCWQDVKILKILKNKSDYAFGSELSVAHYSWDKGIPIGISTIYLEKYSSLRKDVWRLVGGSVETGVSHRQRSGRQRIATEQYPKARRIIRISGEEPGSL